MVEWTEEERAFIREIFSKLKYEDVGSKSLCRFGKAHVYTWDSHMGRLCAVGSWALVVYPWTQRYFSHFGNLYSVDAIMANPEVIRHGAVVLHGLDAAMQDLNNIKSNYAGLSELHSEKLHVDPDNFKLLADCITVVIATKMRAAFTPPMQAAWYKFLSVVVSALSKQYH